MEREKGQIIEEIGEGREVDSVDANAVIAIIERRRAKFQAQRRSGPQEYMDEAARLITDEYDALLAEIEVAIANQPAAARKNRKAEAEILGDQGQSGG